MKIFPPPPSNFFYLVVLLINLILHTNCSALDLEAVSSLKRVFPDTIVKRQKEIRIELWAARNEYESAQVAMQSDENVTIGKIEMTDLVNTKTHQVIVKKHSQCRFPQFVYVKKNTKDTPASELDAAAPGWFPDPLEEKQSLTFKGVCSLWATWYVPSDSPPGEYRGELIVTAGNDTQHIPVVLHVWNFALPSKPSMYVTNWLHTGQIESQYKIGRNSEEFWRIVEMIARDMIAHRQNVIFTPLNLIKSTKTPEGSYVFDFKDYEKWVAIFMRNGFQIIEGSHLFHPGNSYDIRHQTKGSNIKVALDRKQLETPEGQAYLTGLLTALQKENIKLGIEDKYFQHVGDEPKPEQLALYKEIAGIVHRTMPGVPIFDAVDLSPDMLKGMTDIPVPLLRQNVGRAQTLGNGRWGKWWYTATVPRGRYPNRFIDYPLAKMRVIPWLNACNGVSGYLHYGYNYWFTPSGKSPWEDTEQAGAYPPGDGFVVYPPVNRRNASLSSSLRWETFRDGLEDYEYIDTLKKWKDQYERNGLAMSKNAPDQQALYQEAKNILDEVCRVAGDTQAYSRDPVFFTTARFKIGSLLDKLAK
jgi:hypothetical protein